MTSAVDAAPLHPVARELAAARGRARRAIRRSSAGTTGRSTTPVAWPRKVKRRYSLVPTICFNCEAACGLLAYVDQETLKIQKFEGNPMHPGQPRAQLRQGPGDAQPGQRPRAHPLSAASASGRAAAASGSA